MIEGMDNMLHLKWGLFGDNFKDSLNELRRQNEFCDVSIVTNETQINCHKVVLSSCSEFFRRVLTQHRGGMDTIIYLHNISSKCINNLVTFMYESEVSVRQEDLGELLMVASNLEIKGLSQSQQKEDPVKSDFDMNQERSKVRVDDFDFGSKSSIDLNSNVAMNPFSNQNISKLKKKKTKKKEDKKVMNGLNDGNVSVESRKEEEGKEKKENANVNSLFEASKANGCKTVYSCKVCPYTSNIKKDIVRHVKDVHSDGERVECSVCKKSFKNKNSLRSHFGIAHKNEKKADTTSPNDKTADEPVDMTVEVTPMMTEIKTEVVEEEEEKPDEDLIYNAAVSNEDNESLKFPQIDGYFMSVGERVKFKAGLSVFENFDLDFI